MAARQADKAEEADRPLGGVPSRAESVWVSLARSGYSGKLMRNRLKMRRDGARAWLLCDAATGADIGGIEYVHASDGNHYRPWLLIDGARQPIGEPLPQLAMAARAVEEARA